MACRERASTLSLAPESLKRMIQREVETPIAKKLLGEKGSASTTLLLDAKPGDNELSLTTVQDINYKPKDNRSHNPSGDVNDAEIFSEEEKFYAMSIPGQCKESMYLCAVTDKYLIDKLVS